MQSAAKLSSGVAGSKEASKQASRKKKLNGIGEREMEILLFVLPSSPGPGPPYEPSLHYSVGLPMFITSLSATLCHSLPLSATLPLP